MDHATKGQECFISLDRNTNPRFHFTVELYFALIQNEKRSWCQVPFQKAPQKNSYVFKEMFQDELECPIVHFKTPLPKTTKPAAPEHVGR